MYKSVKKKLTIAYLVAIILFVLVVVSSGFSIWQTSKKQQADSTIINKAGRQRMLSQKLTKCSLVLVNHPTDKAYLAEMKAALDTWRTTHYALQEEKINDHENYNTPEIRQDFKDLEPLFLALVSAFREMINSIEIPQDHDNLSVATATILSNEPQYLKVMDKIVNEYTANAQAKMEDLKKTQFIFLGIILLSLPLIIFFIFKPVAKQIEKQVTIMQAQGEEIKFQNDALFKQHETLKTLNSTLQAKNDAFAQQKEELLVQQEEIKTSEEELKATNDAMRESNMIIEFQKVTIEQTFLQLKKTTDRFDKSINYAREIQRIVLPSEKQLSAYFADHFTFYYPKDMVSGDFYWFQPISETKAVFVLADCTGHGVPGAFMSMISSTLLHKLVKVRQLENPAEILQRLHDNIFEVLKQKTSGNSDGLDLQVCIFDKDKANRQVHIAYAGAKSFMFYWADDKLHKINGDRIAVGGFSNKPRIFTRHSFTVPENTSFYFTTDGYIDQNNHERQRFSTNRFTQMLENMVHLPFEAQREILQETIQNFQSLEEQRDDISVIGLQV